jgi:hypothetical protein
MIQDMHARMGEWKISVCILVLIIDIEICRFTTYDEKDRSPLRFRAESLLCPFRGEDGTTGCKSRPVSFAGNRRNGR